MKKIVLFFVLIANAINVLSAQLDTIGKYPYLYHYNWPETGIIHDDTIYCNVIWMHPMTSFLRGGTQEEHVWWSNYIDSVGGQICEYALYQHSDTPLEIIGLALGFGTESGYLTQVTLYDSAMTELSSVHGIFMPENSDSVYIDTSAHHFLFPGIELLASSADATNLPFTYLYYRFFEKSVLVSGDYFIGIYPEIGTCMPTGPAMIAEKHGEPYTFESQYRLRIGDEWSPIRTNHRHVPTLFAILKLPCEPLDSVNVVMGTDGCLQVDWDAPELQSSWTVSLTLPNGSEIVQPTDTNHWEYCGLAPGAYYRVKVRSRCDDINGHSWSDWSREFSVGNPQAIAETALPTLEVRPNPTDGTVAIPAESIREVWCVAADGRRSQLKVKNGQVSLKDYPAGLYVLEIQTAEGLFAAKVMKR